MKRIPTLLILGLLFLLLSPPVAGQAQEAPLDAQAIGPDTLYWRTGTLLKSASPAFSGLVLRNPTPVARFQSNAGVTGMSYMLGAVSRSLRVADVKVYILSRSGSYSGNAIVEVWAYSMAGASHHRISAGSLNIQSAPTGAWQNISLSATPANRLLSAGQSLVITFDLSAAAGSNLDVYTIYEATLTTHTREIYLPMIRK